MIEFYLYDSDSGRVLATGQYDELGDGALARSLKGGHIDPATQYAPGGVITARAPASTIALDKTTVAADGIDKVRVSNVPNPSTVFVALVGDAVSRATRRVTDGFAEITFPAVGQWRIDVKSFPVMDTSYYVNATGGAL